MVSRANSPDELQFSERVVAFIDVLGFTTLVQRMEGEPALRRTLDKDAGIYATQGSQIEMTSFSDCTVLSTTAGNIIVADDVAARAREADEGQGPAPKWGHVLRRDVDGCWFINPFHFSLSNDPDQIFDDSTGLNRQFQRFRGILSQGLRTALLEKRADVIAKHRWLITRFNETVTAYFAGVVAPISIDAPSES